MSMAVGALPVENVQERVFELLRQVRESSKAEAENHLDFSKLHEGVMQLEEFIFALDPDEASATTPLASATTVLESLSPDIKAGLNDAYCLWETRLESQFAQNLIQGKASLSDYPLYERFGTLMRRELSLVSNVRPQRILFLGSGPFPISAIHAHLQTGLPIHCVSRDPGAAPIARTALEKCELNSSIRVFCDGDTDYCVSDYDVVLIEPLAKPKKSILRNLRKRCRPGCQILCRTSHGLRTLLYEATPERDVRGFHVKAEQVAESKQTISTLLLETAGSAASDIRLEWLSGVDSETATQLLRLMNRTLEEETTIGFPGPIDDETGYALMRQMDDDVKSSHRHVLVASKDSVIVGQLILTPNSSPNHRHIVELTRGTIHPSFRGGGLALLAFQEVARKCEELGREVICLDVRAGTMAAVWWQHFGFKPYGLLSDYSRVGGKKYQGLYLFQTTADLQQRVKEIASDSRRAPDPSSNWPD
jgi:hypothetical protein